MRLTRRSLLASSAALAVPAGAQDRASYRDPKLPVRDRVRDLLGRMTLEEKVAQLSSIWSGKTRIMDPATGAFSADKAAVAFPNGIGQIARPSDHTGTRKVLESSFRDPSDAVTFINAAQRHAVESTRLGIPVLFHEETAHGLAVKGGTCFPVPPALGSTWDPSLIERVFTHVARQARMRGITIGLSPVLDLMRDPRWGRSEEFFGEDPYLVSEMATAAVRGLQGRTRPIAADRVFATLKHFIHGSPQNGINVGPSDMSDRMLRETYLPPFAKAISVGRAAIVMPSYNEVGGVPAHANAHLLREIGRKLLNFQGPYFSDYAAIEELSTLHRMGGSRDDAAVLAMKAGIDADLPDNASYKNLTALVRTGLIAETNVDSAVSRILALKFEAGLFEHPYVDPARAARVLADPAGPALARTAAQKAIVLLTNNGILPLDSAKSMTLAVIGPNAVEPRLGGYSGLPTRAVGILEGIKAAAGSGLRIEQADGVWITAPDKNGDRQAGRPIIPVPRAENDARIRQAVLVAERSDAVLLVVGDNEQITRETINATVPGDRNDLTLFGDQDRLVEAMLATGKPVIALLLNGRPLAVTRLADKAAALIEGWYLGEQGGHAVADVIFGKVNPGGKLTVTFPKSVGELPSFYDRHPSADKAPYVEGVRKPLFAFGHGLSYTSFSLSPPRLSRASIAAIDRVSVEIDIANIGPRDGDEVVQVYVRDMIASVPRPILELKAFRRVSLKRGEHRTVRFDLGADELAFWDAEMRWTVEPGEFRISVGNSSTELQHVILTVT